MSLVEESLLNRNEKRRAPRDVDMVRSCPEPFTIIGCEKAIALLDRIESQLKTERGQDILRKEIETSTSGNIWIYETIKHDSDLNLQVQHNTQILRRSLDHIPKLEHCTLYLEVAEVADFRNFSTVGLEVMFSIISLGALTPKTPATLVKIIYEPPKQTWRQWVRSFWY